MIDGHGRTHNEIKVSRFDRGDLVRLIQNGSSSPVVPQVEYIARYCETLGAKTVVVEERYVDRHYPRRVRLLLLAESGCACEFRQTLSRIQRALW